MNYRKRQKNNPGSCNGNPVCVPACAFPHADRRPACRAVAQARRTGRGLRKNVDLFYATTGLMQQPCLSVGRGVNSIWKGVTTPWPPFLRGILYAIHRITHLNKMKLHIQLKYGLLVFSFRLKALAGSIVLD